MRFRNLVGEFLQPQKVLFHRVGAQLESCLAIVIDQGIDILIGIPEQFAEDVVVQALRRPVVAARIKIV